MTGTPWRRCGGGGGERQALQACLEALPADAVFFVLDVDIDFAPGLAAEVLSAVVPGVTMFAPIGGDAVHAGRHYAE